MMTENGHIAFHDLIFSLENYKDRIAIIEKTGEQFTYADFKKKIVGAQQELINRGVKKGDKILVFVPMSIDLYAVLEALFSLGATAIFLDPWMKGKKMSQVIRQVKPDLFVVTKKINRLARLLPATWFLKKWIIESIPPSEGDWKITAVNDNDNALITFTSGTSGKPKGANRTFSFLHAQANVLKSHLINASGKPYVELTNFPIVALADFAMGNTVVIPDVNLMKIHTADSTSLLTQIKKAKVNRLIVSPALLNRIVEGITANDSIEIDEIVTGGAPISNHLIKKCIQNFPSTKLEAIYGSTESEPICITDFQSILNHFETPLNGVYTGKPVDVIQLKIVEQKSHHISTSDFKNLILSETMVGEIIVTGDHVNKNYFENEAAFLAAKIVDEDGSIWHRTGDLGYINKGEIYLVGRDHRVMKFEGKNFYPYPIEQFIEKEFGLRDLGYVQNKSGKFILFIGNCSATIDLIKLISEINRVGYPIDEIKTRRKPLPRDARHKSKLQVEDLI